MKIPDGISQAEVEQIVNQILGALSHKLVFGSHSLEDIQQQGWIIAIEGLNHFNHECNPKLTVKQALENFLRVHIINRLKTFKRNSVGHSEKPTNIERLAQWEKRMALRWSLLSPTNLHAAREASYDVSFVEDVHFKDLKEKINKDLPVWLRSDFLRMLDGVRIPKSRQNKVREAVALILKLNNEAEGGANAEECEANEAGATD